MTSTRGLICLVGLLLLRSVHAQEPVDADRRRLQDRYEQVLVSNPVRSRAFDKLYEDLAQAGELPAWLQRLERKAEEDIEAFAYPLLAGFVHERQGRFDPAARAYDEAVRRAPTEHRSLEARALLHVKRRRPDAAVADYLSLLGLELPSDRIDEIFTRAARLLRAKGRFVESRSVWSKLLERHPELDSVREELATSLEESGELEAALEQWIELAKRAEDEGRRVEIGVKVADLHRRAGRVDDERRAYAALLGDLAPGSWLRGDLMQRLEKSYRRDWDLVGLLRFYDDWIRRTTDDLGVIAARSGVLAELGRFEDAVSGWRGVLAKNPDHEASRRALAETLGRMGRRDEQMTELKTLAEARPEDAETWRAYGEACLLAPSLRPVDRKRIAVEAFRRIASARPDDPTRALIAAEVFEAHEMYDETLAHKKMAVARDPSRFESHLVLIEELSKRANNEKVSAAIAALGANIGSDVGLRLRWAGIWRRYGFPDEALAALADLPPASGKEAFEALALEARLRLQREAHDGMRKLLTRVEAAAEDDYERRRRALELRIEWAIAAKALDVELAGIEEELGAANDPSVWQVETLARLRLANGDRDGACQAMEQVCRDDPGDIDRLDRARRVFQESGDREREIGALEALVELVPARGTVHLRRLAELHAAAGRRDEALRCATRLVKSLPSSAEGYLLASELLVDDGDRSSAVTMLDAGVQRLPDDESLRGRLGRLLLAMGRKREATGHLVVSLPSVPAGLERARLVSELLEHGLGLPRIEESVDEIIEHLVDFDLRAPPHLADRQELLELLDASASMLTKRHPRNALRVRRLECAIAVDSRASLESALAILELVINLGDGASVVSECARLLPLELAKGEVDREVLGRIYRRVEQFLFSLPPEAGEGATIDELSGAFRVSRLVDLAVRQGNVSDLEAALAGSRHDLEWGRRVGEGFLSIIGCRRSEPRLEAANRQAGLVKGRLERGEERPISTFVLTLHLAARESTHAGAAELARAALTGLVREAGVYRQILEFEGLLARAALRRGDREAARAGFSGLLQVVRKHRDRRGTRVDAGLGLYRELLHHLDAMRETGFWEEAYDLLAEAISRGERPSARRRFRSVRAAWRRELRQWTGLNAVLDRDSPSPGDHRAWRKHLFFASAARRPDAVRRLADAASREFGDQPSDEGVTLAEELDELGYVESSLRVLLASIPRDLGSGGRRQFTFGSGQRGLEVYAPARFSSWFASPRSMSALAMLVRQRSPIVTARRKWLRRLLHQIGGAVVDWSGSHRRAYHETLLNLHRDATVPVDDASEYPDLEQLVFAQGELAEITHALEALGRVDEARELLLRRVLGPQGRRADGLRRTEIFRPWPTRSPGRVRQPARELIRLTRICRRLDHLRHLLERLAERGGADARLALELGLLVALEQGETTATASWARRLREDESLANKSSYWRHISNHGLVTVIAELDGRAPAGDQVRGLIASTLDSKISTRGRQRYGGAYAQVQLARWYCAEGLERSARVLLSHLEGSGQDRLAARLWSENGNSAETLEHYRRVYESSGREGASWLRQRVMNARWEFAPLDGSDDRRLQVAAARAVIDLKREKALDWYTRQSERNALRGTGGTSGASARSVLLAGCQLLAGDAARARATLKAISDAADPPNLSFLVALAAESGVTDSGELLEAALARWPWRLAGWGGDLVEILRREGRLSSLDVVLDRSRLEGAALASGSASLERRTLIGARIASAPDGGRPALSAPQRRAASLVLTGEIFDALDNERERELKYRVAALISSRLGDHGRALAWLDFLAKERPRDAWKVGLDLVGASETSFPRPASWIGHRASRTLADRLVLLARDEGRLDELDSLCAGAFADTAPYEVGTRLSLAWTRLLISLANGDAELEERHADLLGALFDEIDPGTGARFPDPDEILLALGERLVDEPRRAERVGRVFDELVPRRLEGRPELALRAVSIGLASDRRSGVAEICRGFLSVGLRDGTSIEGGRRLRELSRRMSRANGGELLSEILDEFEAVSDKESAIVSRLRASVRSRVEPSPPGIVLLRIPGASGGSHFRWQLNRLVGPSPAGQEPPPVDAIDGWSVTVPIAASGEALEPRGLRVELEAASADGRFKSLGRFATSAGADPERGTFGIELAVVDPTLIWWRARLLDQDRSIAVSSCILVAGVSGAEKGASRDEASSSRLDLDGGGARAACLSAWCEEGRPTKLVLEKRNFFRVTRRIVDLEVDAGWKRAWIQMALGQEMPARPSRPSGRAHALSTIGADDRAEQLLFAHRDARGRPQPMTLTQLDP